MHQKSYIDTNTNFSLSPGCWKCSNNWINLHTTTGNQATKLVGLAGCNNGNGPPPRAHTRPHCLSNRDATLSTQVRRSSPHVSGCTIFRLFLFSTTVDTAAVHPSLFPDRTAYTSIGSHSAPDRTAGHLKNHPILQPSRHPPLAFLSLHLLNSILLVPSVPSSPTFSDLLPASAAYTPASSLGLLTGTIW